MPQNVAEGTPGSLGNQPWAHNPPSMTDTGDAYQPDEETQERLYRAIESYANASYTPIGIE